MSGMIKLFMRVVGVVLLLVGAVGFVMPFEGLFDLNALHNIVHLATGALALYFAGSSNNVMLTRVFGVIYLLVGLVGLFTTNLFGILPLDAGDTVIHFLLALAAVGATFLPVVQAEAAASARTSA